MPFLPDRGQPEDHGITLARDIRFAYINKAFT